MNQVAATTRSELESLDVPLHEIPGEPAEILGRLAARGMEVERDPRLLALRARCRAAIGHTTSARDDIRTALELTDDAALRRWLSVLDAEYRFFLEGDGAAARAQIMSILEEPKPSAELPTSAYAYRVLAEIASAEESVEGITRASGLLQLSARLWKSCGSSFNERRVRRVLATDVLIPLGRFRDAIAEYDALLSDPSQSEHEVGWVHLLRGFAKISAGLIDDADSDFRTGERMARDPLDPERISTAAWGRAVVAARRGDLTTARKQALRAGTVASALGDDLSVPCLCDLSMELGSLGDLTLGSQYVEQARQRSDAYGRLVDFAAFLLDARRGVLPADPVAVFDQTEPALWARGLIVLSLAAARRGNGAVARDLLREAEDELARLGFGDFGTIGEAPTFAEVSAMLTDNDAQPRQGPSAVEGRMFLGLLGPQLTLFDARGREVPVGGRNQRALLAVIAANGGSISVDAAAEALWPDQPTGVGRRRLHNIHTRLRDAVGRSFRIGEAFTLSGIDCDLVEFERLAGRAVAKLRTDPDGAAELAFDAVALGGEDAMAEFAGEWADITRDRMAVQRARLVDFLAIRAADSGNAQLAERWEMTLAAAS